MLMITTVVPQPECLFTVANFMETHPSKAIRIPVLGLVVAASLLSGCNSAPPSRLSAEQTAAAVPEIRETSASLQERFRLTPHESNDLLGGKVIEVTGPVVLVGQSAELGDVVLMSGGTKGSRPVMCQMASPRPWDQVTPGVMATIKGQVWRVKPGSPPLLLQAHLGSVDPEVAASVEFSAEDVSASFSRNRSEAHQVLADRWIRVTGEVSSVDRINGWLYLKGGTTGLIRCALAGRDGELLWDEDLQSGEWIEVVGQVVDGDRKQVILQGCLPPRRNLQTAALPPVTELRRHGPPRRLGVPLATTVR